MQMLPSQLPSPTVFLEFHRSVKAHAGLSREQRERLGSRIAGLGMTLVQNSDVSRAAP